MRVFAMEKCGSDESTIPLALSREAEDRLAQLRLTYPDAEACLLPALYLAQDEFGCLTHEVMELVAKRLQLPPERVLSTATFYTMFKKVPVGRHHIQVCSNVSCYLRGSDSLLKAIEEELHIRPGETTEDGLFSLSTVECLASCGTAPALQVNYTYHEKMTPEAVRSLIRNLKEEQE